MQIRWVAFVLAGAALAQSRTGRGINFYSREQEAALGKQMAEQTRRDLKLIDDAVVRQYLDRLTARLAATQSGDKFPHTIAVFAGEAAGSNTLEPPALPGGYIFVPASLLLEAQSEGELAGMLAHAMAHVHARHSTRLATRAQLTGTMDSPLIRLGDWSAAGRNAPRETIPLGALQAMRSFEAEADRAAVKMLADAGYSTAAFANLIDRTQIDTGKPAAASPLQTREARLTAIRQAISEAPAHEEKDSPEFLRMKDSLRAAIRQ